jgi:hypothetical protein
MVSHDTPGADAFSSYCLLVQARWVSCAVQGGQRRQYPHQCAGWRRAPWSRAAAAAAAGCGPWCAAAAMAPCYAAVLYVLLPWQELLHAD